MGSNRIPSAAAGDHHPVKRKKRAAGLALIVRHGYFHVQGTIKVADASCRVRESTGIQEGEENRAVAEAVRHKIETEKRNELLHGIKPSVEMEIAIARFLAEPRERPLNEVDVKRLEEIMEKFRGRKVGTISETDWHNHVDERMAGRELSTRERYLNILMSLLNFALGKGWLVALPKFKRVASIRKPKHRRARRVAELTDELIVLMAANAGPHLSGQIAMMWTAGQRVSSSLYGCRVCDYVTAPGMEQITFHDTKNGEPVVAAVHPAAALLMERYLAWRGDLHDREAPLFLTHRREPYADNDKAYGGQTKRAFQGMKRRTIQSLRDRAAARAGFPRRAGDAALVPASAGDDDAVQDRQPEGRHGAGRLVVGYRPHLRARRARASPGAGQPDGRPAGRH